MVTCGWYGKVRPTSSGPWRTAAASCSHREMPSTRVTNTTGDTGRNVPVPRRCTRNGSNPPATFARWSSISGSSAGSTSVGGTSVMCVGIIVAVVSPTEVR